MPSLWTFRSFHVQVCIIVLLLATATRSQTAFVDPQYKLVEWEGWGTSLVWSGDVLGGLSQPVQDEIVNALYSPEKLNLNIVRYVIGGTTPEKKCGDFQDGGAAESFRDSAITIYRWERDPRARKILLAAKNLGADTFEAYSKSPPGWIAINGCTNGNLNGTNFDPKHANAFADYLTEVVKYYNNNYNLTFSYLSPFASPTSGRYSGRTLSFEGCNMERSTMLQVVKSVHASLEAKNLPFCKTSLASDSPTSELENQKYLLDANVTGLYSKVNVWNVPTEKMSELYSLAEKNHHKLWMTYATAQQSSLPRMTQGINIAEIILRNLRDMLPSAWIYTLTVQDQLVSGHGIIDVPYGNATVENIKINSAYYTMMQFSKYIKKGYSIVHTNDWDTVAAYDEKSKTLVLVSTNSGSDTTNKVFDLRAFSEIGKINTFRTSSLEPHIAVPSPVVSQFQFQFDLVPMSVTTYVIQNANRRLTDNLIRNGNFESGLPRPWYLLYGSRDDNGVNDKYTFRGMKSGYLDFAESKLSLVQNVTVTQTRAYYLSAWCAADGPNTLLGVLINGYQGPEITINLGRGYQLYGLTVDAKANDVLSVYMHAEKGDYTAQIDDVTLH